jgi:hypothetical protein
VTETKVIERLRAFAPAIIAAGTRVPNRCIAATAVGCGVLEAFEIEARPFPVLVEIANRAFVEARARGADDVTAIARGGHLMLISREPVLNGWCGHLMIHVPTHGLLIDLDFQQFRRLEQDIAAAPAELFPWPAGTTSRAYTNLDGARMAIQATDDRTWEGSPDWSDLNRRRPMVTALIRAIRKNRLGQIIQKTT